MFSANSLISDIGVSPSYQNNGLLFFFDSITTDDGLNRVIWDEETIALRKENMGFGN